MLTKLSIILEVPKSFFAHINYLYESNHGLDLLKKRYNEYKDKYSFPYSFEDLLLRLDYIYCVDLLAYINTPDKEVILSGKETEGAYEIHPEMCFKLSQNQQSKCWMILIENILYAY